jgi:hypothetical protein
VHATPQSPQLSTLDWVSTHQPPHAVSVALQVDWQAPTLQTLATSQLWSQAPQ